MKKKSFFPALVLFLVAMICIVTALMIRESGSTAKQNQIHVIIDNSNDNRWVQFIEGMKQAAEDQQINLTIVPTGHIETLSEEETLIERAITNGADGVVVQLCSSVSAASMLERLSDRVSIELVDEDAYEVMSNVVGTVSPDHRAIGEAIAGEVAGVVSGPLKEYSIGVIGGNPALSSMQQRLAGFTDALESAGTEAAWVLQEEGDGKNLQQELAQQQVPDILVALDNTGLETAGEYAAGLQRELIVIGTGTSTKAIYYLDSGIVQSLVVPEEYMMGYQSVSDLADHIHRDQFLPQVRIIPHRTVSKETLFAEENQEILFPIQR